CAHPSLPHSFPTRRSSDLGPSQWSSLRMLSPLEFVAATLIMAVGSAFQAAVGLGLALLVVPFLALIDTRFIPGPMLFAGIALTRSEEHTSELQSRFDLVCR